MTLALFDFDGTITTHDSLLKFIQFSVGDVKALWGMFILSPMLIRYKLKLIPNDKAKELLFAYFFRGMHKEKFKKVTQEYSLQHIDSIVRPKAMEKIQWHQKQGHTTTVVSASIECWLKPWCTKNGLNLIGTKIEIKDNVVSGKFLSPNCYGIEKVNRVKEAYTLNDNDYIYAYGDSRGDKELLNLANKSYYKPFEMNL